MSCYFVAYINIHDEIEYEKYLEGAAEIFRMYKGEYLAVDNIPQVVEGNWNYTRIVLIKFPQESDFNQWYYSSAYQDLLKHRLNGAVCESVLVHGLDNR